MGYSYIQCSTAETNADDLTHGKCLLGGFFSITNSAIRGKAISKLTIIQKRQRIDVKQPKSTGYGDKLIHKYCGINFAYIFIFTYILICNCMGKETMYNATKNYLQVNK